MKLKNAAFIKFLYGLLIFGVLYFDPVAVGGVKFAVAWKFFLVIVLFYLLIKVKRFPVSRLTMVNLTLSLKSFFNSDLLFFPAQNFLESVRVGIFGLLYESVRVTIIDRERAGGILIFFCQIFVLSAVPFHFGFLESQAPVIEFSNIKSYVGIFQNPHGASAVTALSTLALTYFMVFGNLARKTRIFYLGLVLLGIYSIYQCFVRTGYLMFVVGLFPIFWTNRRRPFAVGVMGLSILLLLSIYFLSTSEALYNRIFDINEMGRQGSLGSGRLILWEAAVEKYLNGELFDLFFGVGLSGLMSALHEAYGLRVNAHNGFITTMVANGLVGFLILVTFYIVFFLESLRFGALESRRLILAFFFSTLVFEMVQGGVGFPHQVLLALALHFHRLR